MVIFFVTLAVSAARARFCSIIVTRLWCVMVIRRLVVATKVAFVMVVCVMIALPVVVVVKIATAWLAILGVVAALLLGVLGLVPMDVTRFARKTPAELFVRTCRICSYCREIICNHDCDCNRPDNHDCVRYSACRPCSSFCRRTCSWPCFSELQTFYGLAAQVGALVCHCSF